MEPFPPLVTRLFAMSLTYNRHVQTIHAHRRRRENSRSGCIKVLGLGDMIASLLGTGTTVSSVNTVNRYGATRLDGPTTQTEHKAQFRHGPNPASKVSDIRFSSRSR